MHERAFLIDEELYEEDIDETKPSPFQRSARKSMFLDEKWGRWEKILETMNLPVSIVFLLLVRGRDVNRAIFRMSMNVKYQLVMMKVIKQSNQ